MKSLGPHLEVRNMMPQLKRELGIQNSLRHKHILRVVSIVEDPMYLAGFLLLLLSLQMLG